MPSLSALPEELRVQIVKYVAGTAKCKVAQLRNLSLVCRMFNFICGYFIFRKYHLILRGARRISMKWYDLKWAHHRREHFTWEDENIRLRLAHLQSKAPFVRKIFIVDEGETNPTLECSKPKALPIENIPELLSTLRMLTGVIGIHLLTHRDSKKPNTVIDTDLWKWVLKVEPSTFTFSGHFEIPKGEMLHWQRLENLHKLRLHFCTNANKALIDLLKPRRFFLSYSFDQKDCFPYKPSHGELEGVFLYIDLRGWEEGSIEPWFDFSNVPQASIFITATHYYQPIGAEGLRLLIQAMLEQSDLSGFEGCHDVGVAEVTMRRPMKRRATH